MSGRVDWGGTDKIVARNMGLYGQRAKNAAKSVANYWAPIVEAYAKENANWTDQTANARQTLHAFVDDAANDAVAIYLSHGMDYGLWLEIANSGKYAIILPALEAHYDPIIKMLREIFS